MCGIAGILGYQATSEAWPQHLESMKRRLVHRGPDGEGSWWDAEAGVGLGHRRLAIIDISEAGRQPMLSISGRYCITYNGEIYNYRELQEALRGRGVVFRGHCDTEVLLAAIECWGLESCLEKLNGIFAFALWDREERRLTLVRDRFGVKPLYYGWQGSKFYFASGLDAITAVPGFERRISRGALALYLRYNHVPAPHSMVEGIFKLRPGTLVGAEPGRPGEVRESCYWSANQSALASAGRPFAGSFEDARDALGNLLDECVRQQLVSDVPLGAFLSGGIDSSAVVASMQHHSPGCARTFSIGFEESQFNEAPQARAVARHLGTDHTERILKACEMTDAVPTILGQLDEPFADSSLIPTWFVSKCARDKVVVSLSGDGGDELFSGYVRYIWGEKIERLRARLPAAFRKIFARMVEGCPSETLDTWMRLLTPLLPRDFRQEHPGQKLQRLAGILGGDSPRDTYESLLWHERDPTSLVPGSILPACEVDTSALWKQRKLSLSEIMMLLDTSTYLPDDILTKVDRASMALGLEARVPLLDHRLFEFAWSLPMEYKRHGAVGKAVLRSLVHSRIPPELIERPKMGFGIPLGNWLRTDLRDWVEVCLDEKRLCEEGYFDATQVRQRWREHLSGRKNWQYQIWNFCVFQQWLAGSQR